jgi:hypothetical protein
MFSNCSCYSVLARVTLESTKGSFYLSSNVWAANYNILKLDILLFLMY